MPQASGYPPGTVVAGSYPRPRPHNSANIIGPVIKVCFLLVVVVGGIWGYKLYESKQYVPVVVQEQPTQEPAAEPTQEPATEPTQEPQMTLEDRLREVMALQKNIEVPHDLADGSGSVIRVEPDGIHIRHSSGIRKINIEELSEEILTKYHIKHDTGNLYRSLIQKKMAQAEQVRAQQAKQQRDANEVQSRAEQAVKDQKAKEKDARNRSIALQQWAEYDRLYSYYRKDLEEARRRGNQPGRVVRMPQPPRQPSVPRP